MYKLFGTIFICNVVAINVIKNRSYLRNIINSYYKKNSKRFMPSVVSFLLICTHKKAWSYSNKKDTSSAYFIIMHNDWICEWILTKLSCSVLKKIAEEIRSLIDLCNVYAHLLFKLRRGNLFLNKIWRINRKTVIKHW